MYNSCFLTCLLGSKKAIVGLPFFEKKTKCDEKSRSLTAPQFPIFCTPLEEYLHSSGRNPLKMKERKIKPLCSRSC